ncbi:TRPT1 [Mytilus coruscus]|uniref:TRPT1 n=1 Tax=Mytilus coruscus TaxID=42192 RepID=A0A6J8A257_MYTCO|nr:TRPT1 [Mytilus coruscus]
MALERAPVSTWKVELEKSDKKFENKLGQVHEKLDNMMDHSSNSSQAPLKEAAHLAEVAEVAIVGSGVGARDKDGNREPSVSVKVKAEIESEQCSNLNKEAPSGRLDCYLLKCLANILRHGALELDHSFLPGGYLQEEIKSHPGFAGYSLPDIQKLIKVDVDRMFTLIKDTDSGSWKIKRPTRVFLDGGYPNHTISREM